MRYFYNPLNHCKYDTDNEFYISIFIKAGYEEISKKEFDKLEDVF